MLAPPLIVAAGRFPTLLVPGLPSVVFAAPLVALAVVAVVLVAESVVLAAAPAVPAAEAVDLVVVPAAFAVPVVDSAVSDSEPLALGVEPLFAVANLLHRLHWVPGH